MVTQPHSTENRYSDTQQHDGDGLVVRRDPTVSEPIFYLRSTVLGGEVMAEINGMGTNVIWGIPRGGKIRTHLYNGANRVATQTVAAYYSPAVPNLTWRFIEPITGTEANWGTSDGTFVAPREPDPHGVHVMTFDSIYLPPLSPDPEQASYTSGASWNPNRPTYTLDGITISESFALEVMAGNSAVVAPADEYVTIVRNGTRQLARFQAYADGYQGYVPVGASYLGNGVIGGSSRSGGFGARSYRSDTNLARLNGATGEASLGRASQVIPKIDHLPTSGGLFTKSAYETEFYPIIYDFLNNPDCVSAFSAVGVDLVKLLTGKGIRLGPRNTMKGDS